MNIASESQPEESIWRKRWKTLNEREVLECYFELDPEWSRKTILYVKDMVHLTLKQIYKWGYEKRRRLGMQVKQDKQIDVRFVTPSSKLDLPIPALGYNAAVAAMFPEEENEDEKLSVSQREIYDYLRKQLVERSQQYEEQSDLDKLLNDRIPIKNLALEAMAILPPQKVRKTKSEKSVLRHSNKRNVTERTSVSQEGSTINPTFTKSASFSVKSRGLDLVQKGTSLDVQGTRSQGDQFGSESNGNCKDSINFTNGKESTNSEQFSDLDEQLSFASAVDAFISRKNCLEPEDTFCQEVPESQGNSPIFSIPHVLGDEGLGWHYESLNAMASSLLDSDSELFCPTN